MTRGRVIARTVTLSAYFLKIDQPGASMISFDDINGGKNEANTGWIF